MIIMLWLRKGRCMNKKWLIYLSIAIMITVCGSWKLSPKKSAPPAPKDKSELIVAPAIIDATTDLTRVPALQSGLVETIDVSISQQVKKGQLLFTLIKTTAENNVMMQEIGFKQAKSSFLINTMELKHATKQWKRLKNIDPRAISRAEVQEKKREMNLKSEQLKQSKNLLSIAKMNLKNARLSLSQFSVYAPKDGIVLQINTHINEFVGAAQPIMMLGDAEKIMVRISMDERDAYRFKPNAPAYITNELNTKVKIPIQFIQLDPFIITQDRLNARVQEALYYCNRKDSPSLIAGQQFSAYLSNKTNT